MKVFNYYFFATFFECKRTLRKKYEFSQATSFTVTIASQKIMAAARGFIVDFGRFLKILKNKENGKKGISWPGS